MPIERGHRSVGSHGGDEDSTGQGDRSNYHTHDTCANFVKCRHVATAPSQTEDAANGLNYVATLPLLGFYPVMTDHRRG